MVSVEALIISYVIVALEFWDFATSYITVKFMHPYMERGFNMKLPGNMY